MDAFVKVLHPRFMSALKTCFTATLVAGVAHAAEPVAISFTQATQASLQNGSYWKVRAPTGSQIVVKATPEFLKQSKTITLKYNVYGSESGWKESLVAPGPTSLTLNAQGVAAAPLKFNVSTQWSVMACYSWKPPGAAQKTDGCSGVNFEGVDPQKENANKEISFFFQPPSTVSAKQAGAVAVMASGQTLRLRVAKDVLMRSTNKTFRLYWDHGSPLPANEKQPPGQVYFGANPNWGGTAAKVDMEGNDWGEIAVALDFGPHKGKANWTLKACTEIDWSGEICSITRKIELVPPQVAKIDGLPKDHTVDLNQPLPPLLPPPSGGGGGGGGGGEGNKVNPMAPPPVLGQPATGLPARTAPAPQGAPAAPVMAPAMSPASAGVPGCAAVAGVPGQYACVAREAYAGCERLRAAGAAGIRACTAAGEGRRR